MCIRDSLQVLPSSLTAVEIPPFFSPSVLGTWGGCRLKLIAMSRGLRSIDRLNASPELSIGTFAHRVIERFANEGNDLSPAQIFDDEYIHLRERLLNDPLRSHFADLATTKTVAEWAVLRGWILSRCERQPRPAAQFRGARGPRSTGTELSLQSARLRLRGSADRVRRMSANEFEIRDFKSGSIFADDGAIKLEIKLQLQAYGLMVVERHPRAVVRLLVDDGHEHEVEFNAAAREEARRTIMSITNTVPQAGLVETSELTSPGPGCWGCSVRHVCNAYRTAAPGWWNEYPVDLPTISRDTWGTVSEIRAGPTVDAVVRDAAGRRVRIDRLDTRHGIAHVDIGQKLWMFDLESTVVSRDFSGNRFHPRGFHELPRDRRERRAWRLQIYREV